MSNVVNFGKDTPQTTFLRQRLAESERGEIDGVVMIWERADGSCHDDCVGVFSEVYDIRGRSLDWALKLEQQDDDEND